MTRHSTDAYGEDGSQNRKTWFWPALLGIVLAGGGLFFLARQANGPARPVVDPATAARNNAQYERAMALLEQARPHLEAGRYSQAMPLAEQALALRSDLEETHMAVAQIAMQMREYTRAEQEFQAILQKDPGNQEAQLSLAVIAAARKDYQTARKQIAGAMAKTDPARAAQSIPVLLLQAAANMDQPETAARYARDALRVDGGRGVVVVESKVYGADVTALLADQFEQQDMSAEAGVAYAEAAKDTAGNQVRAQRAGRAAELFLAAGKLEAASGQVRAAIEADPANPRWVVLRERIAAVTSRPASASQPMANPPMFGLPSN